MQKVIVSHFKEHSMKAWKMILSLAVALAFCAPSMAQDEKKKDQGKRPQPTA